VFPFGGRAMAALAVVLGLALLDLGPRASAAFLPGVSSPPQIDSDMGGAGASGAIESERDPHRFSPDPNHGKPIHWAQPGCTNSPCGGAGAPSSSSSSGPTGSVFNVVAALQFARPALVTRLRLLEAVFVPRLPSNFIFEPPRSGS
jgi:hypothetical protein